VVEGKTSLTLEGHTTLLKVFGDHNLLNAHAAYYACKELGLSASAILSGLSGFKGAAKRLELLYEGLDASAYRDFAHAPSKVSATIKAVKEQFPSRRLVAVLELHTYSSLQAAFLPQYAGALDPADEAAVFYSEHALELKRLPKLDPLIVAQAFGRKDLRVFTQSSDLDNWLKTRNYENTNLLLMSSGTFDGLNLSTFAPRFQLPNA
jgi:UDP-N-acetylmuramate: L-alanyl-gamma-D-glutamyl-meso-diaminopimelate ligase